MPSCPNKGIYIIFYLFVVGMPPLIKMIVKYLIIVFSKSALAPSTAASDSGNAEPIRDILSW